MYDSVVVILFCFNLFFVDNCREKGWDGVVCVSRDYNNVFLIIFSVGNWESS